MSRQLYTIGYQGLKPERLTAITKQLDATVIDCRFKPVSRVPGYGHRQLQMRLGHRYELHGHHLGGRGHTTKGGIQFLRDAMAGGRTLLLLCMEQAPGDCHRHHDIARPHFPDSTWHIFDDELILARELTRSMICDDEYVYEDFTVGI